MLSVDPHPPQHRQDEFGIPAVFGPPLAAACWNGSVRDLSMHPERVDDRRIEIISSGLPSWVGAQLAVDTIFALAVHAIHPCAELPCSCSWRRVTNFAPWVVDGDGSFRTPRTVHEERTNESLPSCELEAGTGRLDGWFRLPWKVKLAATSSLTKEA